MLIDQAGFVPGQDMLFGSDGMPHGVQRALEQSLFPPVPGQALTMEEFIAGYCLSNKEHGYIEVELNEAEREVKANVILS